MTLVRQALKEHKGSKHPVAVLVRARSHLGNLTRRLTQEGISCRAVDLVPLAPAAGGGGSGATAAGAVASDRRLASAVARAPFCGLTLTSLQRLFGEDHVTPCPCCWSALREPDPESAASQTPVQGSRRAARCAGGRAGPRARDVLGADEYERLPPPSCWTRATIPAPCPSRPGSRPVGDASAVRRCTRAVRRHDAESLFQLVERLRRTARSTWPRWKPASRGCSPRLTRRRRARSRS